ncbi:hypothetical protein NQ318_021219 [Aromia moschata]|uniref:Uncharacterized protein n=1 Tax=Aromia moschata TaxID=1265417 RepID=A0AAV8X2C2_9CUCU|nr:hypothetical protein NQ318_021219 [Aromia moschata]
MIPLKVFETPSPPPPGCPIVLNSRSEALRQNQELSYITNILHYKTNRSISDRFFVTAVFESYGAVGGIKCKGTVYPGFIPRPTMCEIALAPLFAEAITDKTQMEMNLFTWSTLQLAFKNELDERALEFIEMLSNPTILMLSIKLASRLNKRRLVEKLISFSRKLASETDSGVEELSTPLSTPEPAAIKPSHRKLNLSSAKYSKNKGKNSYDLTPEVQKTQNSTQVVSTPSENNDSIQTTSESVNTQESLFPEEPKNPFLKSVKKPTHSGTSNPLSLTDETAGVSYEKEARETRNGERRVQLLPGPKFSSGNNNSSFQLILNADWISAIGTYNKLSKTNYFLKISFGQMKVTKVVPEFSTDTTNIIGLKIILIRLLMFKIKDVSVLVYGYTQNSNVSFNPTVWALAPKSIQCGKTILDIATHISIGIYNDVFSSIMQIVDIAGMKIGRNTYNMCCKIDAKCINKAEKFLSDVVKEARIDAKSLRKERQEEDENLEGQFYESILISP